MGASAFGAAGAAAGFGAASRFGNGLAAGAAASVSTSYTLPLTVTFVLPASISSTAHLYSAPLSLKCEFFHVVIKMPFIVLLSPINVGKNIVHKLFIPRCLTLFEEIIAVGCVMLFVLREIQGHKRLQRCRRRACARAIAIAALILVRRSAAFGWSLSRSFVFSAFGALGAVAFCMIHPNP